MDLRSKARVCFTVQTFILLNIMIWVSQKILSFTIIIIIIIIKIKYLFLQTLPGPVTGPAKLPKWNYDGSSTDQAPGDDSEVIL